MACLRWIAKLRGRFDSYLLVNCVENYLQQVEEISSLQRLTQLAKRILTAHSLEEMGLA